MRGRFRHHKGNVYAAEGLARDHETREEVVIYRREDADPQEIPEVRPLSEWLGEVRDGVPRFKRLSS